jgi:hypothetical protein
VFCNDKIDLTLEEWAGEGFRHYRDLLGAARENPEHVRFGGTPMILSSYHGTNPGWDAYVIVAAAVDGTVGCDAQWFGPLDTGAEAEKRDRELFEAYLATFAVGRGSESD